MARYDASDDYTYPDSDVLINKPGLRDQAALDAFEADATAIRLLQLSQQPLPGRFDLAHLCAIHRHLFQDVYLWAGQLRTVDISKGGSRFANCRQLESYLGRQLGCLASENWLRGLPPERFVERMAWLMGEINATHPFRDGNGRAQRAFCAQLAEDAGYFIDFSETTGDEMIAAMIANFRGSDRELVALLMRITAVVGDADDEKANEEGE